MKRNWFCKEAVSSAAVAFLCLISFHHLATEVEAFSGASCHKAAIVQCVGRRRTRLYQGRSSSISTTIVEDREKSTVPLDVKDDSVLFNVKETSDATMKAIQVEDSNDSVPSTWSQALHRFFIGDVGPPLVLFTISGFIYTRLQLSIPYSFAEAAIFSSAIFFWWIQEYFFHRLLLHSSFDWIGKAIHHTHHEKNYFHVSIDPPALLLGWLFAAHLIIKSVMPWHLCLSATIGYAFAGLVYEWSHYIVHTKVKPPSAPSSKSNASPLASVVISAFSTLFSQMRNNHIRHHLVDGRYWYAFSVPAMDDLFDTNPNVRELRGSKAERDERHDANKEEKKGS